MMELPVSAYDYAFSEELIAQTPIEPRDHARLIVLNRANRSIEHTYFYQLSQYLCPNDLLVVNESRVLAARLFGHKRTGGKIELLLLRRLGERSWEALVRGRIANPGTELTLHPPDERPEPHCNATVTEILPQGSRILVFDRPIEPLLDQLGVAPLPPYIHQPVDPARYQTVYSRTLGSAAAPTAGLHFTERLIEELRAAGIGWATVTLHVGRDTFQTIQAEDALQHTMHGEWFELTEQTAEIINLTRRRGGRIVAVGTTSVRVLETAAQAMQGDQLRPLSGWTDIYIHPPYHFRIVDALITNFHLPRSTPLLLASAFAGREFLLEAYGIAIQQGYRFFSLGDAMLIM